MDKDPVKQKISERTHPLRRKAEQQLKSFGDFQHAPAQNDQQLIHELQVHQIELQMQNDELRRSQIGLQKARDRYLDLYDFSPIGYVTFGENGRLLEVNLTFADILGQTKTSLLGKSLTRFIDRNSQDQFYLHCRECFAEEGRHTCTLEMKNADNTQFFAMLESVAKYDHDGSQVIRTAITDITPRKQMENELQRHRDHLEELVKERTEELKIANARLLQAQKMEAVGTLTAGISHDFNNILQAILSNTQILLAQAKWEQPEYLKLVDIEKATLRASDLVRRLLVYSRKAEFKKISVDLATELGKSIELLKQTIPKMIHIEQFHEKNLHAVDADSIQIEQIFLNLGLNARDAMPEGGKLSFALKNVILDDCFCKVNPGAVPGEYILIKVADTGLGMSQEVVAHIFEPFFSTKEDYKGAGLGLAMVYGIVKNHGGYILCDSEPGRGTTFSIYLPATEKVYEKTENQPTIASRLHGNETILLVDDEKALLILGEQILSKYGYHTLTAESGEQAIECYQSQKHRIDLVIMDLSMPGMGGYQCFQKLIKLNPDVKVIIASGYSGGKGVMDLIDNGALAFIGKPYQLTELPQTVRGALDK